MGMVRRCLHELAEKSPQVRDNGLEPQGSGNGSEKGEPVGLRITKDAVSDDVLEKGVSAMGLGEVFGGDVVPGGF